jgi:hypothetical protein
MFPNEYFANSYFVGEYWPPILGVVGTDVFVMWITGD